MSANISGNRSKPVQNNGSSGNRVNKGSSTKKHSAVNNPVPGKGGRKNK